MNNFKELFSQFVNAEGIDDDKIKCNAAFMRWLKNLKIINDKYRDFVETNSEITTYDNKKLVELNKGIYDSLLKDNNKALIVSKYTMLRNNIILGRFFIENNTPCVISYAKNKYKLDKYKFFATHNPYNYEELDTIARLHLLGKKIIVGFYGNIYDKDKSEKEKQLNEFINLLKNNYTVKSLEDNDYYFHLVYSKKKTFLRKK